MEIQNIDPQITLSLDYNQWLKHLDTQLNEQTNENSIKSPRLLSRKKTFTMGN